MRVVIRPGPGASGMARVGGRLVVAAALALGGCADLSVKVTGSSRAGTEQLLLTEAADRAIACIDFRPLAGARVYLDASRIKAEDADWLAFSLRRAMARQGLLVVDETNDAEVVMEAAVAAYGTDEVTCHTSMPGISTLGPLPLPSSNASAPGGLTQKSRQDVVVKLALVAFEDESRRLVWESGTVLRTEHLDRRFLGTHEIGRSSTLPVFREYPRRR